MTSEPARVNDPKHRGARSRVRYFLWWLVRVDPEILSGCPTIDHFQMISKAVLLFAVAGIALFAWGGFFAQFWPLYIALPLTVVVIVWIVMIDQIMGASRWALQGVLAVPGKARVLNAALVFRLVIGGITASATSYSATMLISHATIAAQEQSDRDGANAAKRAAGEAEKAKAWQGMLGARDAEVKQASDEFTAINSQLDATRRRRDAAGQEVVDSKIAADCELNGGKGSGCLGGRGTRFRAALTRQGKAADDLRRAESDIRSLEAQLADAKRKRDDAVAAFRTREVAYLAAANVIDARVAAETVPARDDPVMSYVALQKVFASPDGAGAQFFAHLMLALLLTVELSYVLVSEYFAHASVYMARLIARTRILAADAADEYRQKMGARGQSAGGREATAFRVIPRFQK